MPQLHLRRFTESPFSEDHDEESSVSSSRSGMSDQFLYKCVYGMNSCKVLMNTMMTNKAENAPRDSWPRHAAGALATNAGSAQSR